MDALKFKTNQPLNPNQIKTLKTILSTEPNLSPSNYCSNLLPFSKELGTFIRENIIYPHTLTLYPSSHPKLTTTYCLPPNSPFIHLSYYR